MSSTPRDDIEAARARGLTLAETAELLGATPTDITTVWDRMDELAAETDVPLAPAERSAPQLGPAGRLLEPCGTHAAFARHKDRGQPPCHRCRLGERAYQTEYARRKRARTRRAAAEQASR